MEKPASIIFWALFSPSRLIFDALKKRSADRRKLYRAWSRLFIRAEILLAGILAVASIVYPELKHQLIISIPLLILAWSRINEMAYAFYNDALSSLDKEEPGLLSRAERARMALKNYLGLIIYFSLFYYFHGSQQAFSSEPEHYFDCLYFSTITITSLGYGDIFPEDVIMKAFAMYEALLGLLVLAVAIGTYIGGGGHEDGKK